MTTGDSPAQTASPAKQAPGPETRPQPAESKIAAGDSSPVDTRKDDNPPDAGQPAESAENDREQEPAGTERIAALLTRAYELMAGEQALASANIAFQINNPAAGQVPAIRRTIIGTHTLTRTRRTFVAPAKFSEVWQVLADRELLLLRGAPGDGREHLAVLLLDAFCDARVRRLAGGPLPELSEADLTEGAGHLWLDSVDQTFDKVSAESVRSHLQAKKARLVVVWPDGLDFPPELIEYSAEPGYLDLDAVIRAHLDSARAEDVLAVAEVVQARKRLRGARHAAQLGILLGRTKPGSPALAQALAEFDAPSRGAAGWFADLPEPEDKAFALALAALDGLSLPSVVAGARRLDQLIQQNEDREGLSRIRPFHRPAQALLAAVEAECIPEHRETEYGRVPITAVRSRRIGYAREMLETLWVSFPYLQEVCLEWLDGLARDPDPYVRERAALFTGLLAAHDFDFIRNRLLATWAADEDPKLQRAAATALRPAAVGGNLREIVWRLLDRWATRDQSAGKSWPRHGRRLTAAIALGGPVGDSDPERALDVMTRRLLSHVRDEYDYELWAVTAAAATELFGDGGSATSDAVLHRAEQWATDKEIGPSNVAVALLLGLAGKPPQRSADGERTAPLLRAAGRNPGNIAYAAGLFRKGLGHLRLADATLRGLRLLAEHSGGHEALLVSLVEEIPRTNRELRTLLFETRRWAQDDPHTPIFDRLHAALVQEETR